MDLLIEKLDGSRYYLSQYKVLITDFEESAPSVTRNSKQLDQRNGNIDFGGWHTDKTINVTGYYRADDMDEEETLREKLYALLSDPDGYYITQLKTTPSMAMERPGETSGGYYDKLSDYPSHKRFLVYTEAPELELVGNVGGTLLYKLTAEFKTLKLPYGESLPQDLDVNPNVPYIGRNLLIGSTDNVVHYDSAGYTIWQSYVTQFNVGDTLYVSADITSNSGETVLKVFLLSSTGSQVDYLSHGVSGGQTAHAFVSKTIPAGTASILVKIDNGNEVGQADVCAISHQFANTGSIATDWSPAPEDPEYNDWYAKTYYNTKNLAIPYAGTVPCNQLEQGFTVKLTAKGASSSLSFKIDDTELTYNGAVTDGDVFMFSGFSYTQNGLSIVSKTNKAYFILHPDKPNRITCNVHGTVKILGLQNLYA